MFPDISGFYFLEGESDFTPDKELVDFLAAGEPPVYIGSVTQTIS
jgi:sterol 3beta-glucosyltransferase